MNTQKPQKTLILSCNTGEGHNSCAKSLKEYYEENGEVCEIADALGFVSQKFSELIAKWHVRIYRHAPKLFDRGYNFSEEHPSLFDEDSTVYHVLASGAGKLRDCIVENGYDSAICTHVFSAAMLSAAMNEFPEVARRLHSTSVIVTDYTVYPMISENSLDYCFVPYKSLVDDFVVRGVPRSKLIASGIPVRRMFFDKSEKRAAKEGLHIPADAPHLLVMCGSMGCGPMRDIVCEIADRMGDDCYMTVVCGTNEKLRGELTRDVTGHDRRDHIRILGYTKTVAELMSAADLYLTQLGGISVTEAATKCLPMAFIDAVAGCEEGNREFFVDRGGAVTSDSVTTVAQLCADLLHDPLRLAEMSERLRALDLADAAAIIHDVMSR